MVFDTSRRGQDLDWLSRPAGGDSWSWTSRLLELRVCKDKVGTVDFFSHFMVRTKDRRIFVIFLWKCQVDTTGESRFFASRLYLILVR